MIYLDRIVSYWRGKVSVLNHIKVAVWWFSFNKKESLGWLGINSSRTNESQSRWIEPTGDVTSINETLDSLDRHSFFLLLLLHALPTAGFFGRRRQHPNTDAKNDQGHEWLHMCQPPFAFSEWKPDGWSLKPDVRVILSDKSRQSQKKG